VTNKTRIRSCTLTRRVPIIFHKIEHPVGAKKLSITSHTRIFCLNFPVCVRPPLSEKAVTAAQLVNCIVFLKRSAPTVLISSSCERQKQAVHTTTGQTDAYYYCALLNFHSCKTSSSALIPLLRMLWCLVPPCCW
jgi:hypothetical protein